MTRTTLVPDTNVWRYVVDADAVELFRLTAKQSNVDIVACPAVVYECLRTPDPSGRLRLAEALTRGDWVRPMPEAYLEAEELRREVMRLRPEWLRRSPDLVLWYRLRADWLGGFWRRARENPNQMAKAIRQADGDLLDHGRARAKESRNIAREMGHSEKSLRLHSAWASFVDPAPGWDGERFDAWRLFSEAHWRSALLIGSDQTAIDWLEPWLDIDSMRVDVASWFRFWTREADVRNLPREWVHWAMAEVQALAKVTNGTPVDNQIAAYLIDFDIFVTADKGFANGLERIRADAPARLARTECVPTGQACIERLLQLLEQIGSGQFS